jgi:hypothetical protein
VDNEETQRTPATVELGDRSSGNSDSFVRALLKLQATAEALGAAIRDGDPPAARHAANDAFSFLLAALSVFHRMETRERARPDLPRIGTAWYALRTNHRAIVDLFTRAKANLPDLALHQLLEQLEGCLVLALKGIGEQMPPHSE